MVGSVSVVRSVAQFLSPAKYVPALVQARESGL
jgi:hypothetical protein